MRQTDRDLVFTDLTYGRNGRDPSWSLPENACAEAVNVDFTKNGLCQKRAGCSQITGPSGLAADITYPIVGLWCHSATDLEHAELWVLDSAARVFRYAAGAWTLVYQPFGVSGKAEASAVSFNGKFYLLWSPNGYRPRVWDGTSFRLMGLLAPNAPAVQDTGSGAYAATLRYYQCAWTLQSAGITLVRSERSAAVSFTPSGTGAAARVSVPAPPVEPAATHWEVYGSADGNTYYLLATVAVGTSTYDDSTAPASYTGDTPAVVGTNEVPYGRFLATDDNRVLIAGGYGSTYQSRIYFTPALGSGVGDSERYEDTTDLQGWVDVGEKDGGAITGIASFVNGVYVFKERHIYKLTSTGVAEAPYRVTTVSHTIGALSHSSIVQGEDETGTPALYFLSPDGPYRIGASGLQYLGRDIEDVWATTNLTLPLRPHGIYYHQRRQIWWFVGVGAYHVSLNFGPSLKLVFDVRRGHSSLGEVRGGWAQHTGTSALCFASCLFSQTWGSSLSLFHKPYLAGNYSVTGNDTIWMGDTGIDDDGIAYQGYVQTRTVVPAGFTRLLRYEEPLLVADAPGNPTSVEVQLIQDFGLDTRTALVSLSAVADETTVIRKVEGLTTAGRTAMQFQLGDHAATTETWELQALIVPVSVTETT